MDWFLYDNSLRHERVKYVNLIDRLIDLTLRNGKEYKAFTSQIDVKTESPEKKCKNYNKR